MPGALKGQPGGFIDQDWDGYPTAVAKEIKAKIGWGARSGYDRIGFSGGEVTIRPDAIALIAKAMPDAMVGAGTVLNCAQFDAAVAAGARFVISPGMTPALLAPKASAAPLAPRENPGFAGGANISRTSSMSPATLCRSRVRAGSR